MCDTFHRRHQRLRRLESLLPAPGAAHADCPDGARLLRMMADAYGEGGDDARRRALYRMNAKARTVVNSALLRHGKDAR